MFILLQSFTFLKPYSFRYFLQFAHVCVIPFLHFSVLSTFALCPRYRGPPIFICGLFFVHNLLNTCLVLWPQNTSKGISIDGLLELPLKFNRVFCNNRLKLQWKEKCHKVEQNALENMICKTKMAHVVFVPRMRPC